MKEYVYDNTFEGLFTAIFYAYSFKEDSIITKSKDYIPSFLNEIINIKTEYDKFERVYKSIIEKLSDDVLRNIYYLYLSDISESDSLSLKYLRLCYSIGVNINLAKNNDIIISVDKYVRKVTHEAHRFTGFVRFKEVGPLSFYASIEPDHNILPLILSHFTRRFSDQNFIIHDLKRELAIVYNKDSAVITELKKENSKILVSSNNDDEFEALWKTFYKAVNIKERKNHRLRNQHMPKRYWDHLTELI
ncbi:MULTISPECIES: TIGR03915 family putative DNA repair protein [Clostridium]|uniref:TIGR03915 family putative DNA repair protein n=1 Tax=Clostridium cibarium TaxID=2762247 RepID=A0ABR8PSP9_9CLOT|nr:MULTISPECIES: TIGR03915 family putative DNA repair protein [Clostridium]MBD7911167.1 TIGR03915 family putative DNA repair protein [Clostridium cibarium]